LLRFVVGVVFGLLLVVQVAATLGQESAFPIAEAEAGFVSKLKKA
jgi:hypothetical protein